MILREVSLIVITFSCLSASVSAQNGSSDASQSVSSSASPHVQDLSQTVFPITSLKLHSFGIEADFGTGFCLDSECRFVGTTYHVAILERPRKIRGEKVIQRYLATGPDDEGATMNDQARGRPLKYTRSRDLAVFELRRPLPHSHGIALSLDELQKGQEVDIYTYPKEGINPFRSLRQYHGTFKGETTTGLLAFDYSLSAGRAIRPGSSGGIVVDSKSQQVVGILNEIERSGEAIALAVPIESLADFVNRVQPWLAQRIFPIAEEVSAVSPDVYPKFALAPSNVLQRRTEEPDDVKLLRNKAQLLADSMRNYIAVQTYVWGSGRNRPVAAAAYEVRVIDGSQRFREYPDGKRELPEIPAASIPMGVTPGDQWSKLPEMVGAKLGLRIKQAPDVVINDRRVKVFQYQASREDSHCRIRDIYDFGIFSVHKDAAVASYGEVWTDEDTNILRISEHCEPTGGWRECHSVVTYAWLKRRGEPSRLVPVAIAFQSQYKKRVYWCRGQFVNYREFIVRARLVAN